MSKFEFDCPHCKQTLEATDDMYGQLVDCPSCNEPIEVPYERQVQQQAILEKSRQNKKTSSNPKTEYNKYNSGIPTQKQQPNNLGKCKGCGKTVHPTAETCPHCGIKAPVTVTADTSSGIGALIGLIIGIGVCIWIYSSCSSMLDSFKLSPEEQAKYNKQNRHEEKFGSKNDAYSISKQFVKKSLKSPSSSKFPWYEDSFVTDLGEGKYLVSAYVDAQNAFGAMIRTKYVCALQYTGAGDWRCTGVEVLE